MTEVVGRRNDVLRDLPNYEKDEVTGPETVDDAYHGSIGKNIGVSTVGYRSAKHTGKEWHENVYEKYFQAFADRENSEKIRNESQKQIKVTDSGHTQDEVTNQLRKRLMDINFWMVELQREIEEVITETDLLIAQRKRLENAYKALEIPLHIATECLRGREQRYATDLVQDSVELGLLKELSLINNVRQLLEKTIEKANEQIIKNRDMKQKLEFDWSDKKEAHEIDLYCAGLNNNSVDIEFKPGSVRFQEGQSSHEDWAKFSYNNLVKSENERIASADLRNMIDCILLDTAQDIREQANVVDIALSRRINELHDAKMQLDNHLHRVVEEIANMEKNIQDLKDARGSHDAAIKVAQTRMANRARRRNIELCRDPAQYKLMDEMAELGESQDTISDLIRDAESSLKDLMDTRMMLEKEIQAKTNSLNIDIDKCQTARYRYPSTLRLSGYQ